MNNELPVHIITENFSDLKHKINNKWPNVLISYINACVAPYRMLLRNPLPEQLHLIVHLLPAR